MYVCAFHAHVWRLDSICHPTAPALELGLRQHQQPATASAADSGAVSAVNLQRARRAAPKAKAKQQQKKNERRAQRAHKERRRRRLGLLPIHR